MANEKEDLIAVLSTPVMHTNPFIKSVADKCIQDKNLLTDLVKQLSRNEESYTIACSRIFLVIAKKKPNSLSPLLHHLLYLLKNQNVEIRIRVAQAIDHISQISPNLLAEHFKFLFSVIKQEKDNTVRDFLVSAIANSSGTGREAAFESFQIFEHVLQTWKEVHAQSALTGVLQAVKVNPELKKEGMQLGKMFLFNEDDKIKQMAVRLLKKGR